MKKLLLPWRHLSTRFHLAMGLAGLCVGMLLSATYLGLIPDAEGLTRQHRGALSESIALTASALLDEERPENLQKTLEFLRQRNPGLLSMGVRSEAGALLVDVAGHASAWPLGHSGGSDDGHVTVPVWQAGEAWGHVELRFEPLRTAGWRAYLQDPSLRLSAFAFVLCAVMFSLYLRRMLRELDPSRAVPARVRTAYDTLTEGLVVVDPDGTIVLANKSTSLLLGVAESALVSRSPSEFGWSAASGAVMDVSELPWQRALRTKTPQRDVHLTVSSQDGRRYSLRANCSPLLDDSGKLQALVISFQDVTELEQRGEMLRAAKEQADAANEAKSQFLANMSHEIRTPMNAILGFTEVLRRGGLRNAGDAGKHLDIIHSSGKHLLNLINDILDLSKVEAGKLEAERQPFAAHAVAQDVVQTMAERAVHKGLTLELVFAQALPAQVEGDAVRWRQILTNLIGNAIKFTEHGGVQVVSRLVLAGNTAHYVVDVQDSGIGIPADKLDTVFEPFVQAEASTTRRFGGTGLGLTISRSFARAMGGDITVTSQPGQGTTFSVWLPLDNPTQALLQPAELMAEPAVVAAAASLRWQFPPARVLVVDDGVENRQLVRVLLEEAGLVVSEAENGQIAVDRVGLESFDLVLMDMQMPVMDGQTATRTLRARGCTLPILALTANAMKGFERELEEAGFSGFQTKPVDVDSLLQDLAQRLGGQPVAGVEADDSALTPPARATPAGDDVAIVSRLANRPKFAGIVTRFVEQLPARLAAVETAAAAGRMEDLMALAHGLKGAGGSMGFDEMFEPARALETAAASGDAAAVRTALADLQRIGRGIQSGALATPLNMQEATA